MKRFFVIAIFFVVVAVPVSAQEPQEPYNLGEKFDDLIQRSETYQVYKVIRRDNINALWSEVIDTLSLNSSKIQRLSSTLSSMEAEKESLTGKINDLDNELLATKNQLGSVSFLGAPLPESTYHAIVWVLIIVLIAIASWLGWMYRKSFEITDKSKKEYQALQKEYDIFRDASREKQVKIKRELQTALNDLEDLKKTRR